MHPRRVAQRLGLCNTYIGDLRRLANLCGDRSFRHRADLLEQRISDLLDEGKFMTTPCPWGDWDEPVADRRSRMGVPCWRSEDYSEDVKRMQADCKIRADQVRRQCWAWRVGQTARELQDTQQWHPFFITLTVDPVQYDREEIMRSKEARRYLQRCSEVVRQEGGLSRSKSDVRDYFRYAGAVEHGDSGEHHHAHFLVWVRYPPQHLLVDPNDGLTEARRNDADFWLSMWPYGTKSDAQYFRSIGDIWVRRYGFRWPAKRDGSILPARPPEAAGEYIVEYFSKEHKQWPHRMKCTRSLGLATLHRVMDTLPLTVLEAIRAESPATLQEDALLRESSVPLSLIRQSARDLLISKAGRTSTGRRFLRKRMWTKKPCKPWKRMVESVQAGHQPSRMDSVERFDWLQSVLHPEGLVSFRDKREFAWRVLAEAFPAAENESLTPLTNVSYRAA